MKNPAYPREERVDYLLAHMRLEEKAELIFITMTGMEKVGTSQERVPS